MNQAAESNTSNVNQITELSVNKLQKTTESLATESPTNTAINANSSSNASLEKTLPNSFLKKKRPFRDISYEKKKIVECRRRVRNLILLQKCWKRRNPYEKDQVQWKKKCDSIGKKKHEKNVISM